MCGDLESSQTLVSAMACYSGSPSVKSIISLPSIHINRIGQVFKLVVYDHILGDLVPTGVRVIEIIGARIALFSILVVNLQVHIIGAGTETRCNLSCSCLRPGISV